MLITHQDSNMKKLSVLLISFLMVGCAQTAPKDLFVGTPQLLKQRQVETRRYDGILEMELVIACANVLQDLGFNLENSETKLGVITASKERDASHGGEIAAAVVLSLLSGVAVPFSKDQTIRVALVVRPIIDSKDKPMAESHFVRITFQRIVRKSDNSVHYETLTDPVLFKDFFEKVSKSVFLEAQKI